MTIKTIILASLLITDAQRTVTFTVKNKGDTYIFLKDVEIPALKGTATTAGQQAECLLKRRRGLQ